MSNLKIFAVFYGFVLRYKLRFLIFLSLVVVSSVLSSLTPYYYKAFVDAIPNLDTAVLFKILLAFALVKIASLLSMIVYNYLSDTVLLPAAADARTAIFKHVQDLDYTFHTQKSTGSLISAFKRGDLAFFTMFHVVHHAFLRTLVAFFVMVYFFLQVDLIIGFAVSITVVLMLVVTKYLVAINVSARNTFNKEEDDLSGVITDNLINFETVKFFAKEYWELGRLKEKFKPWLKALWGYSHSFRYIDFGIGVIDNVSVVIILFLSISLALKNKISIGEFVLITAFISNFYARIWDLVWNIRDLAKNYSDIQRYFGLLDYEIEVEDPEADVELAKVSGTLEFRNVSHSYLGGTKNAVKDFDFTIKPGESVAFVGRSGSGKTTITKLLMRFFDPTNGKILIDGIDIKKFKKATLRRFFGVVPQEAVLFNNTIEYNIGYGADSYTLTQIKKAAKTANISNFIEKLPKGYLTNVGERGIKLSGGQKQRLAIARMILSDPDIVIFDEATSHLDSESEKLIQEGFWKARAGKTTIIIAHRLSTVMRADKIVVMEYGKIKEVGTHESLLKQKDSLYSHFWNLQIKLD